ncbi:MAG: DUF4345 family protein [Pseudomonadales bacterium]|nr:DUF4345 family protein [Pseudomonadales bacterium]
MKFAKIILSITAATWLLYGGWLFVDPTGLRYAGFELNHWSAIVEVQAMYGAVEIMLGLFALLGVLKPQRYMHSALLLWFMIYSALVVGRITGIIMWDGSFTFELGPEGLPESYNPGAMWFLEIPSAILCGIALWLTKDKV